MALFAAVIGCCCRGRRGGGGRTSQLDKLRTRKNHKFLQSIVWVRTLWLQWFVWLRAVAIVFVVVVAVVACGKW